MTYSHASPAQLVRAGLARVRSELVPGPDIPGGRAPLWASPPLELPERDGLVPLGRVLRLALAAAPGSGGRLRPAPSAGALHPVDAHLLVGPGCGPPPGRYAYDARAHRVHRRGPAPPGAPTGTLIVLTVTARRTVAHYGHRAWPLLLLDAGHAVAALASAGATAACPDADGATLAAAAGLPHPAHYGGIWPGAEPAHPVAAVWVGPDTGPERGRVPAWGLRLWATYGQAAPPVVPDGPPGNGPVAGEPGGGPEALRETWQLLTALGATPPSTMTWRPLRPVTRSQPWPENVLLSRRSAPPPLTGEPSRRALAEVLAVAARAWPGGVRWCVAVGGDRPELLELDGEQAARSALPAVNGHRDTRPAVPELDADRDTRPAVAELDADRMALLETGAHQATRPALPKPTVNDTEAPRLRTLASGDARPTLAVWAAGQGWLAEAGAVLLAYGCPEDAGPAEVREAHLTAGYAVGVAQTAATALGLRTRAVGSWQRADLGAALGGTPGRDWIVHALAMGAQKTEMDVEVGREEAGTADDRRKTSLRKTCPQERALRQTALQETGLRQTAPQEIGVRHMGVRKTCPQETDLRQTALQETGLRQTSLRPTGPRKTSLRQAAPRNTAPRPPRRTEGTERQAAPR
ncbi:hypothetical protein [Streptomyces sp. NPDC003077]|uniref:nitroreductase family protein n=1 Tax=Streptomyces sp. NPDC003077 TaxID=3154443 RepID=UPI0033B1A4DE